MTGLRWVRLDVNFPTNQKILDLTHAGHHRAGFVYVCGFAYAGGQGTDGWIPASALPLIHGRKVDAEHLVAAGLWIPRPGGWDIHDWCEYQPSSAETEARTQRARAAALTRWDATRNAERNAERNASRMRPA